MKLVDILARELKTWPEDMEAAYSSGHLVRFCTELGTSHVNVLDIGQEPVEQASTLVTRAEWQAAVDALNALKVVEWPSLGETVEVIKGPAEWDDYQRPMIGVEGKVRSVFKNDFDQKIVAIELSSGECKCFIVECIKPARTAEQVAAEEREKGIQEICTTLGWRNIRSDGSAQEAAALYDAGYRKEQKPCGS